MRRQHGVVSRAQLLKGGFSGDAIKHRIARGTLRRIYRGVYLTGDGEPGRMTRFMAAVLAAGPAAVLSHASAAVLWGIIAPRAGLHVTVPRGTRRSVRGLTIHHRDLSPAERTSRNGIPTTSPSLVLVDLATQLCERELEAAASESFNLDLTDPDRLRSDLESMPRRPGLAAMKALLNRDSFRLTQSELERMFLRVARRGGIPPPLTQQWVSGHRVDFYWPEHGLVVEADSLRFHRTPAQQRRDIERDQAHIAAGLISLRFTHWQVAHEPEQVRRTVAVVLSRTRR